MSVFDGTCARPVRRYACGQEIRSALSSSTSWAIYRKGCRRTARSTGSRWAKMG